MDGRSRAPYIHECYFHAMTFFGVDPVPYAGPLPCRVVPQTQIFPTLGMTALRQYWVTCDSICFGPLVNTVGDYFAVDYAFANRLSFGTTLPGYWLPLLFEWVTPLGEPAYWRTWIGQQEAPP